MPRVVDHNERREQVAEAAWRVIERDGPEAASMRGIAREAGYTTGVITHYFADKRELMAFAFGLMVNRSAARMIESGEKTGIAGALAEILPLDSERRRETTVWLALMGASLTDPELAKELRQRYRQARETMLPIFEKTFAEVQSEDPDDIADGILAVVDGITVDALTDPERYPPERQLALLRRALKRLGLPTTETPGASL